MSQTRTYPVADFFSTGQLQGASTYLEALAVIGDGKYVFQDHALSSLTWTSHITYDLAIPLNASISSVSRTIRFARTSNGDDSNAMFTRDIISPTGVSTVLVADVLLAPYPPSAFATSSEDERNWSEQTLNHTTAFVDAFESSMIYTGSSFNQFAPVDRATYIDYFGPVVVVFTLPAAPTPSTPVPFSVARNSFQASSTLVLNFSDFNSLYPISAYFEYTEQDPTEFKDDATAQFEIFLTDVTIFDNNAEPPDNTTKAGVVNAAFTAQVPVSFNPYNAPNTLLPNKTYWFRAVTSNADSTTKSDWSSVTTLQFDPPIGY